MIKLDEISDQVTRDHCTADAAKIEEIERLKKVYELQIQMPGPRFGRAVFLSASTIALATIGFLVFSTSPEVEARVTAETRAAVVYGYPVFYARLSYSAFVYVELRSGETIQVTLPNDADIGTPPEGTTWSRENGDRGYKVLFNQPGRLRIQRGDQVGVGASGGSERDDNSPIGVSFFPSSTNSNSLAMRPYYSGPIYVLARRAELVLNSSSAINVEFASGEWHFARDRFIEVGKGEGSLLSEAIQTAWVNFAEVEGLSNRNRIPTEMLIGATVELHELGRTHKILRGEDFDVEAADGKTLSVDIVPVAKDRLTLTIEGPMGAIEAGRTGEKDFMPSRLELLVSNEWLKLGYGALLFVLTILGGLASWWRKGS
jgi:hypothetical protein